MVQVQEKNENGKTIIIRKVQVFWSWLYSFRIQRLKQFIPVSFFFFYCLGGFLANPFLAVVIAGMYELAFLGLLCIFRISYVSPTQRDVLLMFFGFCTIILVQMFLDVALFS